MNLKTLLAAGMLLAPNLAAAEVFLMPLIGQTLDASSMDANRAGPDAPDAARVKDSSHYGLVLGTMTRHPGNMYVLYSTQRTKLVAEGKVPSEPVASLKLDYAHIGGSLYFPQGDLMPYVTASVGLTHLDPDQGYSDEARVSFGLGGGLEYRLTQNLALVGEFRGFVTFVDGTSHLFCDAGNCLWQIHADQLWQVQANLGLSARF